MKTNDIDRTPVAKDIITICNKCKLELNHIVIRQNSEGIVERVKCHTCGSEHKYKPVKKKKATSTARKKRTVKKKNPEKEFKRLLEKYGDKKTVPYNMKDSFNEGNIVDHKTFGKGVVTGTSFQRIEVTFLDGTRILAADR